MKMELRTHLDRHIRMHYHFQKCWVGGNSESLPNHIPAALSEGILKTLHKRDGEQPGMEMGMSTQLYCCRGFCLSLMSTLAASSSPSKCPFLPLGLLSLPQCHLQSSSTQRQLRSLSIHGFVRQVFRIGPHGILKRKLPQSQNDDGTGG